MIDKKVVKITFTGDVMCEAPLLKASGANGYNFDPVFEHVSPLFAVSDYIVANLETICTGSKNGLSRDIYSFNSPIEFLQAVKRSGVDMVTTATNHSLDRGVKGLLDNIEEIEKLGLDYIGTGKGSCSPSGPVIKKLGSVDVAFFNYTFGTNCHINGVKLDANELAYVSLFCKQDKEYAHFLEKMKSKNPKYILARFLFKVIKLGSWVSIKKALGLKYNCSYEDNDLTILDLDCLDKIKEDISQVKNNVDLVVVCVHMGGQFNSEPGELSRHMMQIFDESGADLVVANHAHVVQKAIPLKNSGLGAYCLGNLSISPSSPYILHENLPDYSVLLHAYVDCNGKKIIRNTFSILKIEEDESGCLSVYPLDKLYNVLSESRKKKIKEDAVIIYNRFLGKNELSIDILSEYEIIFDVEA